MAKDRKNAEGTRQEEAGAQGPSAEALEEIEALTVPADCAGARVDVFLAKALPSRSRSSLQKLIKDGRVTRGGETVRSSAELHEGDRIEVRFPPPARPTLEPHPMALSILYEDEHMMLLDKPAGLVVHPGAGNEAGTLVHALIARPGGLSGVGGAKRPGIVHRLDRGTSGLLIIAKTDRAHLGLIEQFASRRVEKTYLALVWGHLRERVGRLESRVGRDRTDRKKMAAGAPHGRTAVSRWKVLDEYPGFSMVEVRPETGRTHQIRVHMQSLGHPIVGDDRYGGAGWRGVQDPPRRQALRKLGRLGLHAARLTFDHPISGERLTFESPLPDELRALVNLFGATK